MNLTSSDVSSDGHPKILRLRHRYGIWFGIALGLTFSIFVWGIDAYLLSHMNGLYPWLKFLAGGVPCVLVGGFTGWLAARFDKALVALLLWAGAAVVFTWLTVNLPRQLIASLLSLTDPGVEKLIHYTNGEALSAQFGIAYIWIGLFVCLAGFLQIPLSDSAVFSTAIFGRISPILITMVLMAICGTIIDGLNHEFLRGSIDVLNRTVQFVIDHQGQEIDPVDRRRLHLGALRSVEDLISPQRKFIVSDYDRLLEQVQVLVHFDKGWVECELVINQLIQCEQVGDPG